MGESTFQETAQIVIIETATEHVSYVRLAAGGKGVCFGGLSVRVLAGRACVLLRNVGFFERAAVVVLAWEAEVLWLKKQRSKISLPAVIILRTRVIFIHLYIYIFHEIKRFFVDLSRRCSLNRLRGFVWKSLGLVVIFRSKERWFKKVVVK